MIKQPGNPLSREGHRPPAQFAKEGRGRYMCVNIYVCLYSQCECNACICACMRDRLNALECIHMCKKKKKKGDCMRVPVMRLNCHFSSLTKTPSATEPFAASRVGRAFCIPCSPSCHLHTDHALLTLYTAHTLPSRHTATVFFSPPCNE